MFKQIPNKVRLLPLDQTKDENAISIIVYPYINGLIQWV